jgi:hypothetical protein
MAPRSLRITAGASRRATRAHLCALPRFALLERRSRAVAHSTRAHACSRRLSAPGRALRCRRKAGRSASSWQGFVVSPGGAPVPPEGLVAYEPRRRRAPSRFTTPHERALRRTRWTHVRRGLESGDKRGMLIAPSLREGDGRSASKCACNG